MIFKNKVLANHNCKEIASYLPSFVHHCRCSH